MGSTVLRVLTGGVLDAVPKIIDSIRGKSPEDAVKLQEILTKYNTDVMMVAVQQRRMDIEELQMQADINKEDAKSEHFFQYGWRPYIGWVCGSGLAYQFLLRPFMTWICNMYAVHYDLTVAQITTLQLPDLDMGTLLTCLGGMLGLGAMRMKEKLAGKLG